MKRHVVILLITAISLFAVLPEVCAQRRVTPVNPAQAVTPERIKKAAPRKLTGVIPAELQSRLVEQIDASGNVLLVDTLSGIEYADTAFSSLQRNIYPLLHSVSVGIDIFDPVARLLGQQYGGTSFQAEVSFHNRFKPGIIIGFGSADIKPDGANFRYRCQTAPFGLIGLKYNMFYNSNSDYQLNIGAYYGLTSCNYTINDAVISPGYWDTPAVINTQPYRGTVSFARFTAGIKVKLAGNLSAGWDMIFNLRATTSAQPYGKPLYMPGLGKSGASLGVGLNIYYTIPLNTISPEAFEHWKQQKDRRDKHKRAAENRRREANERGY